MTKDDRLLVATIGKVVGLRGDLKLHISSDFLEQFQAGEEFTLDDGTSIKIDHFDEKKRTVRFEGFLIREEAKKLTNKHLFSTKNRSYEQIELNEGEYFWFDLIGMSVYEGDLLLGHVKELDRIAKCDYLVLKSSLELLSHKKGPKQFLIPYIDRYIKKVALEEKRIEVIDCIDLYEAS